VGRPLLHFLLLGAALFALDRGVWPVLWPPTPPPVVIDAERLDALRRAAVAQMGRPPDAAELAALVRADVDDELLYRRARELGLDRDDPVVFQRLVQNMRFAGADPTRDDAELYREALALGMDRRDVVVRRRLVERMRLAIETAAYEPEPDEAELRAFYRENADRYRSPARVRLTQVFFERGHAPAARVALERLVAAGAGPDAADGLGDPFLQSAHQPLQSRSELAGQFGDDFAEAVFTLHPGVWNGPVASTYGVHLVLVQERVEEEPLPFESVRERVRYGVLARRGERALADALGALRRGVEVQVADGSPAPPAPGRGGR
jgi:PPIC-type PPIASE domain